MRSGPAWAWRNGNHHSWAFSPPGALLQYALPAHKHTEAQISQRLRQVDLAPPGPVWPMISAVAAPLLLLLLLLLGPDPSEGQHQGCDGTDGTEGTKEQGAEAEAEAAGAAEGDSSMME
eukprot:COSAG01_NODE_21680_length_890_cov_2.974716_1_plen_118_part_10